MHEPQEMAERAHRNLNNIGLMARLVKNVAAVEKHAKAASDCATFVIVYAPDESEVEHVMNLVRRRPHLLAHSYQRFAIEDLAESDGDTGSTSAR